ncbi:MAG: hypothetical protein LKJ31_06520 [Atopobiaceae bacterium]|jgi:hypothetical protein|nr:hypothetical protein [Atopobiaceae bacterium]
MDFSLSPGEMEFLNSLLEDERENHIRCLLSNDEYKDRTLLIKHLMDYDLVSTYDYIESGVERGECDNCPLEQYGKSTLFGQMPGSRQKPFLNEYRIYCIKRKDFQSLDEKIKNKLCGHKPLMEKELDYPKIDREVYSHICSINRFARVNLTDKGRQLANKNVLDLNARKNLDENLRLASENLRWVAIAAYAAVMSALFGAVGVVTNADGEPVCWKIVIDSVVFGLFICMSLLTACGKLSLSGRKQEDKGMRKSTS